ncbi:ribulose-phosphate 3-epimerase [Patescibacteria group bacterium]|nr:ribulose-phosphate 3-epimerase [Patescibacteria group bacterium]
MIKPKFLLSASIICSDFSNLKHDLKLLKKGGIDLIHVDIMDGIFVPRLGVFPEIIKTIKKYTSIPLDLHLMIINPENHIPTLICSGADFISIHAEACPHLHKTVHLIKNYGAKVGIALNPGTSLSVLDYIIEDLDLVVIMGINPGILGQSLIATTYRKISDLKKISKSNKNLLIEIDGGVNFETAPKLITQGANILVCGSSTIFNQTQPLNVQINKLHQKINKSI